MPVKNKFWKTTLGQRAEVLISAVTQYSDSPNYGHFVANAVNGEMGVFENTTAKLLVAGNALLANTKEVFVAVKNGSAIEQCQPFVPAQTNIRHTPYAAPVKQVSTVVVGALTPALRDNYMISILDVTPGYDPFPTYQFSVLANAGETVDAVMARLVTDINRVRSNQDQIVTAAYTSGTNTLTLTAKDFGTSFKIVLPEATALAAGNATVAYTGGAAVTPKKGSGSYDEMTIFAEHAAIAYGETTNYPAGGTLPEDYGTPGNLVVATENYDIYNITGKRSETSKSPHMVQWMPHNIILCVPTLGATPNEELQVIFGFVAPA